MANTTSGTTTFDKTFAIDEIVEEAFERIGLQNVAGYQLKSARRSLNILLQEWGNRGIHYWEIGETNLDLIEGQSDYDFFRSSDDGTSATTTDPASVFGMSDVLEAQLRSNRTQTTQSDSPMTKVDRSTYAGFSNKLSKGTPNQYWVERFIDKVRIHIYPTPDSTNASKDMHFYFIKRIQDAGDYTNASDVPFRFVPCMVSGLAYYLAQKYQPNLVQPMKLIYVHVSEFEPKQPQLEPKPMNGDSISLRHVRPDRIETAVPRILPLNPFTTTNGSTTISVNEPDHGRSTSDRVRFRNANVVGGVAAATINLAAGYVITKVDNDNYTFATSTTSSITETGGGGSVSAGPVTVTA
jgi:hypothetical protein